MKNKSVKPKVPQNSSLCTKVERRDINPKNPPAGESILQHIFLTFAATVTLYLPGIIMFRTRNRKKPHERDNIGVFSICLTHSTSYRSFKHYIISCRLFLKRSTYIFPWKPKKENHHSQWQRRLQLLNSAFINLCSISWYFPTLHIRHFF